MAVCNPQELLDANPCLSALNDYDLEIIITQQLCGLYNNLSGGDPLTCDIQELLDDAQCLYGLPVQRLKVLQAQLLCEIYALL